MTTTVTWYEGIIRKKAPAAIQSHTFDWAGWLGQRTIQSYAFVADAGLSVGNTAQDGTKVSVVISGGTRGKDYNLRCRITTNSAEVEQRSILIRVVET